MSDRTSYDQCIEAAGIALATGDHIGAERGLRAAIQVVDGISDSQLELAAALNRLGFLKQEIGSHTEAEICFQRALEVGERALGSEHLGLVPALKGLGTTRLVRGNPQAAEPFLTRALAISQSHLGEDHPDLVLLLNDLTRLYLKQSAFAFAEPLLLRLLELKRPKGEDHPEVATVLASLAVVRQALGRHESAEQLWRRVLSIRERTLAPNHFGIATALEHLAETCTARGKLGEALGLYQRALTIREATLGREHTSLRVSRERIADLELQASEETFDSASLPSLPSHSGQTRRISDETSGAAMVPFKEAGALAATGLPLSMDRAVTARPLEHFVAPTTQGLAMTAVKKPADSGQYLDVLQDIKEEMDVGAAPVPFAAAAGSSLVNQVATFIQTRRTATIVGVAAITLPLVAWGVTGAGRTTQQKWEYNPNAVVTPADLRPRTAPPVDLIVGPGDSAARAAATKFERNSNTEDERPIMAPTAPAVVVKLDSVKGLPAPVAPSPESVLRHLASSANLQREGVVAPIGAPTRARLIGSLPTPRYPAALVRQRTSGVVRVRFDVQRGLNAARATCRERQRCHSHAALRTGAHTVAGEPDHR
jgi:tetratricopeptide (TPR) repeat protein